MVSGIVLIKTAEHDSHRIVLCKWITAESAGLRISQAEEHNFGNGGTRVAVKITWMINHRN